jgi:hypothetical protein
MVPGFSQTKQVVFGLKPSFYYLVFRWLKPTAMITITRKNKNQFTA